MRMTVAVEIIDVLGAVCAAASCVCWVKAARTVAHPLAAIFGSPPEAHAEIAYKQYWWNGLAAWFAAGAAFASVVTSGINLISD
jgi:hypothetical protein